MQFPNDEELKALRERYPAGTLIRIVHETLCAKKVFHSIF